MDDIKALADAALKQAGIHSIKIKDQTYSIELMPARQAFAIATQLMKLSLPSIGAYADGVKRQEWVLPEDDNMFTEVAILLAKQMNDVSVMDLLTLITQGISKNGTSVDVDEEFKGNLGGFIVLLEFVLKENCGSLFQDWLAAKGISLPSLKTATQDQDTTQP